MDNLKIKFLFESSPWLIALCLIIGAIYAFVLYQKKSLWNNTVNWILSICRFLLVSLLSLLLLNFFIKKTSNKTQKKVVGIIIDNSQSVNSTGQNKINGVLNGLADLKNNLIDKGYEVEVASFSKNTIPIDSIKFNQKTSNLSSLIQSFRSKNEGSNITDVILFSDGINNQGMSPSSLKYPFPINTIGIGDTISKKDLILKNVIANKIAYMANDFIIQAEITAKGFTNKNAQVIVYQDNKLLESKNLTIKNESEPTLIDFKLKSNRKGLNRFTIRITPQAGEFSIKNNQQEFYIDIIDGKENILILAPAPHPDIKALKAIIESNENYNLTINIQNQNKPADLNKKFDLVILHQLPDEQNTFQDLIKNFEKSNTPIFSIIGNLTSIAAYNSINKGLQIEASSMETDKVMGAFNNNFKLINFDPNLSDLVGKLPPITVPFGEYKSNYETILYQKLGSTITKKPLLILKNTSPKAAYFLGEGLWNWRMEEYSLTEKNEVIDDLFLKVFQIISAKEDTRKLRIYPLNKENELGLPVQLETEVYNDIYQKIFNQKINLKVTDEKNKVRNYEYTNLEGNSVFQISSLPAGIYKYTGTAFIGGKNETATGEFIIKSLDIELDNLEADFTELRKLSKNTGGKFYNISELGLLQNNIINNQKPDKIISEENLEELINWPWLLFLILLLASIEWASRKYLGGY